MLSRNAGAGDLPLNAVDDATQQEIDASRDLPTAKAVQKMLSLFGEKDSLQEDVSGILEAVTDKLPDIEATLSRWRGQIASAQIAEQRTVVRADLATVDNRISTALQHMREIQTRAIDLSRMMSELARERTNLISRAVERGYKDPE